MLDNLLRFKKDQQYITIDFETESLNLYYSRPWSVAWAISTGLGIQEMHSYYIGWSDLKMSTDAARHTRFNYDEYKSKAKDAYEILNLLEPYLNNSQNYIIGQNILGFDIYQYTTWRKYLKLASNYTCLNRVYDTLAIGKAIASKSKPDLNNMLAWQYRCLNTKGIKGMSLGTQCKNNGVEVDENQLHGASYDATATKLLFDKLIFQIEI